MEIVGIFFTVYSVCDMYNLAGGTHQNNQTTHYGVSCPWGELSVGRNVRGANCLWGELSVGRTVRGVNCPWGELSVVRTVCGRVVVGQVFVGRVVVGQVSMGRVVREPTLYYNYFTVELKHL